MLRSKPRDIVFKDSGIYVFESRHGPDFSMKMDEWDFDKLCFVRQGSGSVETTTQKIRITEDQVIHLPAFEPHRFVDDARAPMTLVVVCYYPDLLAASPAIGKSVSTFNSVFPAMTAIETKRTHRRPAIISGLRRMVFEQTTARPGCETIIWGLLAQLLVMLTRTIEDYDKRASLSHTDQLFAQTLDFLNERFTDPVQIKDLAAMAEISYRRYTTLFRERQNETVNAYINRLRLDFACKRLLETGNVLYSALEAGFGDLSNFYRVFKKATGKTPKQYMAENKGTAPVNPV